MNYFPEHIAIIMDGNRRWANKRKRASIVGHKFGTKSLKSIISKSVELDIKELSIFAFSTENWKRLPGEINSIFQLVEYYLKSETAEMNKNSIQIKFIGNKNKLRLKLTKLIDNAERLTEDPELSP